MVICQRKKVKSLFFSIIVMTMSQTALSVDYSYRGMNYLL